MTSTNDDKDVKSYQTSGPKGKTYYIELYKTLDGRLSGECELRERTLHLCEAWRRVHSLCQHSAPTTHPHLLSWLQRHTARTVLQTEWQSPKSKDEHNRLEDAINAFISETTIAAAGRASTNPAWEAQLLLRGEWFKKTLRNPWGHPVLKALLDERGQRPTDDDILEWLKEERGVMFVTRLRQLAASKCDDLAMTLVTAVMDRVRADIEPPPDNDQCDEAKAKPAAPREEPRFAAVLRTEAGFTVDVWELLTDIEFVLLHKGDRVTRCIELSKQTPLRNGYQLVERLQSRLDTSPREKKLWKNAKDVSILVAQVVIARCMVVPLCVGVARTALYCCTRSLVRLLPPTRLPAAAAALAAPAATARHLHTLAAAVDAQCTVELKPFVCELYVRAITAGMNELERLKLKTEKAPEARSTEQTLCSWFVQLGILLAASDRIKCECTLTAFSVHPTPAMYERIKAAPILPPKAVDEDIKHETTSEFGSWATDSRTGSNLVKTSETLNIKQTQQSANILSTAILTEGEGLGLAAEMCQDLAVLLSGPRVKTLSWDMDREMLLENCRTYMERTHGGTRALTTELKYLNLDPRSYQHLPEEGDDENDVYYGIEKGYEHLVELQEENIWESPLFADEETESACSSSMETTTQIRRKKKPKKPALFSDDESDPLCVFSDMKKSEKKKERPHSKERSKDRSSSKDKSKERKKKAKSATSSAEKKERSRERRKDDNKEKKETTEGNEKKKEKKPRKKKPKEPKVEPPMECKPGSLSSLIGMKVAKIKLPEPKFKKNAERNAASCVTDSDYDSQGKSSLASLNSAGNDPDVLFDGLFSMDDYRSPEKCDPLSDRQPLNLNSEVSFENGQVAVSTATKPETQLGVRIQNASLLQLAQRQNVVKKAKNVKTLDPKTNRKVNTVREEVKRSITKLLDYRRQKNLLNEAQRLASPTPLQNPLPSTYKSPNAIIRQEFPEETVISPKPVDIPEIPKVYINKKQVDQIKDLQSEVDSFIKAKFALKPVQEQVDQINDIKNEVDVYLKSKFSPKPVIQFAGKQNTNSTPQTQSTTANEYHTFTDSQNALRIHFPASKISDASMQKNFQDFLRELQESINAGTGLGAKKTMKSTPNPKTKKEIKPTSKDLSVTLTTVTSKVKPLSSPCAKSNKQGKEVETQLNTFSRLSYMHKNKQQNITPQDLLNRIAEDHKITKNKYMQSIGDVSISKRNTTKNPSNSEVKPNVIRKVDRQTITSFNHTVLTDILQTKQGAIPKIKNIQEKLPKKEPSEKIDLKISMVNFKESKESSLSEEDQNDLLLLLRQQSKQNVHPTPVIKTNVCKVNKSVNNPQCSKTSTAISTKFNPSGSVGEVVIKKYPKEASTNITYNNKKVDDSEINMATDISQNVMYTKIVDCKTAKVSKTANTRKTIITPNKTTVINMPLSQHVLNKSNDDNNALKKYGATSADTRHQDWEKVMDAILSHKTPSRGPNALDMVLKKKKTLRNQRKVKQNATNDASNVAKQSTMVSSMSNSNLIHPPHKISASSTVQLSHSNINLEQPQQSNMQSNYLTTAQTQKIKQEVDKIMQRYTQFEPTKNIINGPCQLESARESLPCKQTNKHSSKQVFHQKEVQMSCAHNAQTNKKNHVRQENVKMVHQIEQYPEITAKNQKKPISTELLQAKDPFISGIPNSDYDLLEELMDDELRKEIGELSSDEDTYRAPTCTNKGNLSSFDRSSNVINNTPVRQEKVYPITGTNVRQNCRGTIIQNPTTVPKCQTILKNINEIKGETSASNLANVSNIKQYSKECMTLTSKLFKNKSVTCTSVIHQPVTNVMNSNINNKQPPSIITNSQINVVDARNVIITAVPQTALQNVVVIGSELVFDPYATMQTQLSSSICNVNQAPYVTFNNNPNIAVYQSTQFTTPAVNPIIIGNAMAVPLSTTSSEMLSACLDTDINRTSSSNQTPVPVPLPATPSEILDRPLDSDIQPINSNSQKIQGHNLTRLHEAISRHEVKSIANISCMEVKSNVTTDNIVQGEITEELIKTHEVNILDINSNKNCERKVLKEVQEKQKHAEQINSIKLKTVAFNKSDGPNKQKKTANEFEDSKDLLDNLYKIENLMNQERLKNKRLAIINREISNRSDNPPIPLSYLPLIRKSVANDTLENAYNSKENDSKATQCRRILLRSCNNLKSNADAADSETSKNAVKRKMKVRLKDERQPKPNYKLGDTNKLDIKADSSNKDETGPQKKSNILQTETEKKKQTKSKGHKNISTCTVSSRKNNKKSKLSQKVDNQTEDICAQVNGEALNAIEIQKLKSNIIPKISALPQHKEKDNHKKVTSNYERECTSRIGASITNHMQHKLLEMTGLSKQSKLNCYSEHKEEVSQQLPMRGNLQKTGEKIVIPVPISVPVPVSVLKSAKTPPENLNIDNEIMEKYRNYYASTSITSITKPLKFVEKSVENKQTLIEKDRTTNNSDILKGKRASNLEQIFQTNDKQKGNNCLATDVFTHGCGATRLKDSNKTTIKKNLPYSNIQDKSEQAQSLNRKSVTCHDLKNSLNSNLTTKCEQNRLSSNNVTEPKGPSKNKSKQKDSLNDKNASTDSSEMAYLKNNITIEELPSANGDPNNKCVRLKLANGKVFKATVFGKMHVSFETLFANPALKNTLLSDLSQSSQRYTLNIKQVSFTNKTDPSTILDARIEEIKLNSKARIIETVDLLSDDEDEIVKNIQLVVTEFGNYKISPVDEQDFEKHKHKLKQKCYVKINKAVLQQKIKVKILPKQSNKESENTTPIFFETKKNQSRSEAGLDKTTPDTIIPDIMTADTIASDKNTPELMTSEIKTPGAMTSDKSTPFIINPVIMTRDMSTSNITTTEITTTKMTALDVTTPDITTPDRTTPDTLDISTSDIPSIEITTSEITTSIITAPHIATPDKDAPDITTPDIATPDITTPDLATPDITTPDITTPDRTTPDITTPDITTPVITTPDITIPDITTLDRTTPVITTPDIGSPGITTLDRRTPDNITTSYIITPDLTTPDIITPDITTEITTPDITIPDITTLDRTTPVITTPDIGTLDITTSDMITPDITTPLIITPDITTPEITTPDITTPYIATPHITRQDIGRPVISTSAKTISDKGKIEIPTVNFNSMLVSSEANNSAASEVIEIDDSSNDSIDLLLNCPILPTLQNSGKMSSLADKTGGSKPVKIINELKHLLLKDLGVDDDTVIDNEVCEPKSHQLTVSDESSTCETCPKIKECYVELSRCDYLVKQYEQCKIIKQKCTVDLIRCDDLIETAKSYNNNILEIGSDEFIDVEGIDVECESLSHLSRSGSFSILNDFSFYNEKTTENYESENVGYDYDRSSPVIDVFETIVAFKNYSITNKEKSSSEQNRLKCYSEWNKTKLEHHHESCFNKNDNREISDKLTVDNTTLSNNASEKRILPSLKSLTAKIFQDNSTLDHYTICTELQTSPRLINTDAKQNPFHSLKRKRNSDEGKSFENKILRTLANRKFLARHTKVPKCQQDSKCSKNKSMIKSDTENIQYTEVGSVAKCESYAATDKTIQADISSGAEVITKSLDCAIEVSVSFLINDIIELVEKNIFKTTESNESYTISKISDDGQYHNVYSKSHKENIKEHIKINNDIICDILMSEKSLEIATTEYDVPVSNMEVYPSPTENKTVLDINSQLNEEPEVKRNTNITAASEPTNDKYDHEVNIKPHNLDIACVSISDDLPQPNNAIVNQSLRDIHDTNILERLISNNYTIAAQNAIENYEENVKTLHNMTNVAVNNKTSNDSCTDDTCLSVGSAHTSTANTETLESENDTCLIFDNAPTSTANTETFENKEDTCLLLDNAHTSTANTETSENGFTDELSDSHHELINNCEDKVSNICKEEFNSQHENDLRSYDSKTQVVKDEILSDGDSHQNDFDILDENISATINKCDNDNALQNDVVKLKCEEGSTSSCDINEKYNNQELNKSLDTNLFQDNGCKDKGYNYDGTVIDIKINNSDIVTESKLKKEQVVVYENEERLIDKDPIPTLGEEVIYYDENVIDLEINDGETKDIDHTIIRTCLENTNALDYVESESEEILENSENAVQRLNSLKMLDHGYAIQSEISSELFKCFNVNMVSKAEQNKPVNLVSSLITDIEVSGKIHHSGATVEDTTLQSLEENLENPARKEVTLLYKDGTDLVLKGIEYKDPVVGTCYLFPFANKSNLHNEIDDSEKVIQVTQNLDKDVTIDKSFDDEYVLELIKPNITYSKRAKIPISKFKKNRCNILKRKRDMSDVRYVEKRYRKGKQIDYPRQIMHNTSHKKEYKRVFDYCTSLKFSFSQPFHNETIDVEEMVRNWPIKGSCYNNLQDENENENFLFRDDEKSQATENLTNMSFVEEINANYVECDLLSENVDEANFNMGFGEGSDRVIQNLKEDGDVSKFSAATLSDVKQPQPFLLSEDYECDSEFNDQENTKEDQLNIMKRYMTYIHLKDKVRSFFKQTTVELCNEWIRQKKDKVFISKPSKNYMTNFPFDLCRTDFLQPSPIEAVVQVVQVGQLPVSAAAQNPVTCDPRVTQVSDASPSQCCVDNSPQDDSQVTIKTEYTELTTADFTLPLMHEHVQHNQNLLMGSQDPSNYSICNENIPIETEIKSVVKIELEELAEVKEENREMVENYEFQPVENKEHDNHNEYLCDTSNSVNTETLETETETDYQNMFNCTEKQDVDKTYQQQQKQQNGMPEKTDQIAHAMNAAGITTTTETMASTTRAHTLVNILSQKFRQGVVNTTQASTNSYSKTTAINAMALQQALAQILPPPLNQTNSNENNHQSSNVQMTPQVLHIVQGKNATGSQITLVDNSQQSVINNPNATPVLHIVQNKSGTTGINSNGTATSQANSFSGLSLVDAGLQQGGNQLLHIVNTGSQKNNNAAGQLLKRVNLLTNLTNVQGSNEQKMVQFVCKSADGKSIQLNAPHQRSMVLRLQPIETPNCNVQAKPAENQDASPNSNSLSGKESQQEIKSRSVYEENYAKFIQNSSGKSTISEKSTSLPKFNQAFGKPVFQDGNQKQNEISSNNSHLQACNNNTDNNECQPNDNAINLDHIGQINSPPLLLRKSPQTSQSQANLVQQLKQTIAPMNIQTMHGGVIYTRQIPVNIGGGQTINLITVPSTELMDDSASKQSGNHIEMEQQSIIKIVPQNQNNSNNDMASEDGNATISGSNDTAQNSQPQPVLTQMRIKLPMLSKAPQMVSGARVVRPSFFQIQRNVIGGANQPVYQQLVLTAAPPLGQQTIRLPQTHTSRLMKVATDNQSTAESQMSSSTLEQLREFDMVLEQVKERSTVQPSSSTNTTFPKLQTSSSDTTDGGTSASSTSNETTQQVLYSIGNNQPLNVAYVNRKATVTTPITSTFVRSPDSSGIIDSPTSTHVQIPHTVTSETTQNDPPAQPKPAKTSTKTKSRPKASSNPPNTLKLNTVPPKTSAQKPLEDEQTTQRILYILAEYKEQVENSPDKDKPAPRRRTNPPSNPGSSKRKKSSSSRRHGARDLSPMHGEDTCRTMGSEDSSCGTSQGDCNESCLESHSPQDSPRKVVRKLTFEHETTPTPQPRPQPQRNVIVADGQTITVARGTAGKPTTAVLMPANYILPVSMVKGGQQIAIVTNRGPKLLTVGGEGGATNALLLQRLIGPAGLKPVLTRPGVRHVRLPTAALHNLQAFNLATATTIQPPDSTASPAPPLNPPELVDSRATSSPWTDRDTQDVKPERASSPEGSEPWHLSASGDPHDYSYEETVRTDNLDRTVLDPIPDRYSPDMEAQRIFDKMFDVESKKSYMGDSHDDSPRCAYDIDASDCDDKAYHQVVQKKDGHRQHRLTHVSAAALRHKYAILEHELRLQKSLSEECEDLGVDSPSASELFPEAELLFAASPAHDHNQDQGHHSHTPQPTMVTHSIPQPDMDDQIATDQLLSRNDMSDQQDLNLGLGDVGIVTVSEDGMQATIALDQEEFARSHPNTTFHSEPTDVGVVQPFTIAGLKGRHITSTIFHSNRAPATVLMTAPQTTVISQATNDSGQVKYDIDNMIQSLPTGHNNINLASVLVKDDGLTRFDSILNDSRELHLSNTASAIVHSAGNATQVIRRVCYDDDKRDTRFLMDEPDALIAGDDAKMIAEDSSRDATLESMAGDMDNDRSSPERHAELFWESNSASERSESRRPMDFSSDSEKCCKSPSYDETNSTDSSGVGTHMRLDSVIKEARGIERSNSADGSSADDTHPPLRTYPPKRLYHPLDGDVERSLSGKTRAGERSPDSLEVRRRASGRGVVKRGCHCCNGEPAPPRPKKARQRKPTTDFTTN